MYSIAKGYTLTPYLQRPAPAQVYITPVVIQPMGCHEPKEDLRHERYDQRPHDDVPLS